MKARTDTQQAHVIKLRRRTWWSILHKASNFVLLALLSFHFSLLFSSCSDDDKIYPNITTEMGNLFTNPQGEPSKLVLDDERTLSVSNILSGYQKNATYRVLCGFVADGASAHIYQLTGVNVLRDSSKVAQKDPLAVVSTWRTKRYINLHLAPKTQGGRHYWGFITDSIVTTTTADGIASSHAYVSLHHKQNDDPTSYTNDVYASLPIDSIKGIAKTDPITLRINTFGGEKTIDF